MGDLLRIIWQDATGPTLRRATSVVLGTLLPLVLSVLRVDAAHASTTIQVIMDVLGVLITCTVATAIFAFFEQAGGVAGLLPALGFA